MGCPCEIRLVSEQSDHLIDLCLKEIARFEQRYSRYRDDSIVTRINQSAGRQAVELDTETAAILDYADVCFELSDGKFDITSGVLRTVWRPGMDGLPDVSDLEAALSKIGWQKVIRGEQDIYLPISGMQIDLGGVVKEYVADALVALLQARGVSSGLINLGGDIAIVGPQPDGSPWQIGVADPADSTRAIATISLGSGAITTSGGYERYFEIDGKRYSHLLDPHTGWPVESLAGVSVIARQAVVAGSISTIALLNDEVNGKAWLAGSDSPYLAIDTAGELSGTIRPDGAMPLDS